MAQPEYMIELEGTPDDVQEMLNFASKVEPGIYRKQRVHPGLVRLWYRGHSQPNDLVRAIRQRAGIDKPKAKPLRRVKTEEGTDDASTGNAETEA